MFQQRISPMWKSQTAGVIRFFPCNNYTNFDYNIHNITFTQRYVNGYVILCHQISLETFLILILHGDCSCILGDSSCYIVPRIKKWRTMKCPPSVRPSFGPWFCHTFVSAISDAPLHQSTPNFASMFFVTYKKSHFFGPDWKIQHYLWPLRQGQWVKNVLI